MTVNNSGNQPIDLGQHQIHNIPFDKMEPGDIVCEYESVSASPFVMQTVGMQKWLSNNPDFSKFTHFSIILDQYKNRKGVYEIAHATGRNKKVTKETLDFKQMPAGQTVVVFRPKNKDLRNQIAKLANEIADDTLHWALPIYPSQNIFQKIARGVKAFLRAKNLTKPNRIKVLKKIARLAVDASDENHPTFLKKDGKNGINLSCSQFALYAAVVSEVCIRERETLSNAEMTRDEKIDAVFNNIINDTDELHPLMSKVIAPFTLSNVLMNSSSWDTVGYVGYYTKAGEGNQEQGTEYRVTKADLLELFPDSAPKLTKSVLSEVKLLDQNGQIDQISVQKREKRIAAFATIHSQSNNHVNDEVLTTLLVDKKKREYFKSIAEHYADFVKNVNEYNPAKAVEAGLENEQFHKIFVKYSLLPIVPAEGFLDKMFNIEKRSEQREENIRLAFIEYQSGLTASSKRLIEDGLDQDKVISYKNLIEVEYPKFSDNIQEISFRSGKDFDQSEESFVKDHHFKLRNSNVLKLERECLKVNRDNKEYQNDLSQNWLQIERIKAVSKERFANCLIAVGLLGIAASVTWGVFFPPITLLVAGFAAVAFIGIGLKTYFRRKYKSYELWSDRITSVNKFSPNVSFSLTANAGFGARPWLRYTEDEGKSWLVQPLALEKDSHDKWHTNLRIDQSIDYEYFMAPYDLNQEDPYRNATQVTGSQAIHLDEDDLPTTKGGKLVCSSDHHFRWASELKSLELNSDVGFGNCPWIYYSDDNKTSFKYARMEHIQDQHNLWRVKTPLKKEMFYQVIVAPYDANEEDVKLLRSKQGRLDFGQHRIDLNTNAVILQHNS